MRVLQLMAGAAHGGAETAFVDMVLALNEAGLEQEVITRSNNPDRIQKLEQTGLTVNTLPFGGLLDQYTPYRIRKIIQDFRPQIVQTWMSRAAMKLPSKRFNDPSYTTVSRLGGYYKLKYFKQTDRFTTITPDIRRHLIDKGVHPDHVRHINNFAETETTHVAIDRRDLDTPEEAPLLVTLSRLHQSKAIDVLLDVLPNMPGVYLWIAGEGPLRDSLEQMAQDNGIADRVRFLGWRNDRAALLQAADICVFPSRYEPFGTTFVQAWMHKTPLVTTNADGPGQYVDDGEDGLVVPVDDADALKTAIRRLLEDKDLAARLSENGYKRYENEFTKAQCVEAYLGFYREIVSTDTCAAEGRQAG